MVNPESFLTSPSLYKAPTNVEMFGLKNPLPTIINAKAKKKAISFSTAKTKCPKAIKTPPRKIEERIPKILSEICPPITVDA